MVKGLEQSSSDQKPNVNDLGSQIHASIVNMGKAGVKARHWPPHFRARRRREIVDDVPELLDLQSGMAEAWSGLLRNIEWILDPMSVHVPMYKVCTVDAGRARWFLAAMLVDSMNVVGRRMSNLWHIAFVFLTTIGQHSLSLLCSFVLFSRFFP